MLIAGARLDAPAAHLSDLLRLGLDTKPEEVAILSNVRALTWSELEDASSRLASGYLGLGLAAGDRVASLMPNRVDLVVHYLACFKAELIATPLNYRYTATEIDHALEVSGARVRRPAPTRAAGHPTAPRAIPAEAPARAGPGGRAGARDRALAGGRNEGSAAAGRTPGDRRKTERSSSKD
ncbi:MAG TPA: AMP-binding protein [Solirubrobacterales bacterium]|jgi:non-ribosomal peptide synthetase component F